MFPPRLPVSAERERIAGAIAAHKVVIVCGATGSGKTTTLYATLLEINSTGKNVTTVEDPVEYAFEQLCNRFDRFLHRRYLQGDNQKGLIVLDKSAMETRLQSLATDFRKEGHRWGSTRNIADVPFFVDSKATRAIQYADLVSYALRRYYEFGDGEFFDVISDAFDSEGGVIHGLHHFRDRDRPCDCPACR